MNKENKNYKKITKYWDYDKNVIDLLDVTYGSNKKAWFKCKMGHSYEQQINSATKLNFSCPICSNKQLLSGFNEFETKYPELIKEWNHDKNILKPNEIFPRSNTKVWWKCNLSHEWESQISSRTSKTQPTSCPYCSGQKTLEGFNDLATLYPDIAKEWHPIKNGDLLPTQFPCKSPQKIWWQHTVLKDGIEYNHEWQSVIYNRTAGKGCPICGGRAILKGYNDFESNYPELAKEWDNELNDLKPNEVSYGSNKNINWICSNGHKYKSRIPDRRQGDGCPVCSKKLRTSRPEKAIYLYLKKYFPEIIDT